MATFKLTPINYTSISRDRVDGGYLKFIASTPITTSYIETTGIDISPFAGSSDPTTFTLTVDFVDRTSMVLWSATTTKTIVGYTLPKTTYNIGYPRSVTSLTISSNKQAANYFMIWGGAGASADGTVSVSLSSSKRPNVVLSAQNVICSYLDTSIPFVCAEITITNTVPSIETGSPINWYISSSSDITTSIAGISVYQATDSGMRIRITSAVYYNGKVVVSARTPSGLLSQAQFNMKLSSIPSISTPFLTASIDNIDFVYDMRVKSIGTGPIVWTMYPNYSYATITSSGLLTVKKNNYIKQDIAFSASNINKEFDTDTYRLWVAQVPKINAPSSISATMASNAAFTYDGIIQTAIGTGPVTWRFQSTTPTTGMTINPTSGVVTVAYGSYIKQVATFTVDNELGGTSSSNVAILIAPTPIIANPGTVQANVATNSSNFTYQLLNTSPMANIVPIIWTQTPALSNLTINNTGLLSVASNSYVNQAISVTAANEAGGVHSRTFTLSVAQNPIINAPPSQSLQATMINSDYTYQMQQTATGTGPLNWYITPAPGLSISSSGLIRVSSNQPVVSQNQLVTASNLVGGGAAVTLSMTVTQTPILQNPGILTASLSNVSFTYQMLMQTLDQPVTWKQTNLGSNSVLTISSTGLLAFPVNNYIDETVTVVATNSYSNVGSSTFKMTIAQRTEFTLPAQIVGSISAVEPFTFVYTIPVTSVGSGALTWSVTNSAGNPVSGLTISGGPSSATLTYNRNEAINQSITVSSRNVLNYVTSRTIALNLLQAPLITPPGQLSSSTSNTNYTYQMLYNNVPNIIWSSRPTIAGLTTNSNTGLLTFARQTYYNSNITVLASNLNGAIDSNTFGVAIAQTPVVINPGAISCNLTGASSFSTQLSQIAAGTGPLSWAVTSASGLAINNAGTVTLDPTSYINQTVTATARNVPNGSCNATFPLHVARSPVFLPPTIQANMTGNVGFQVSLAQYQTALGTGPLTWTLVTPITGVSLNSSGTLIVPLNTFVSSSNTSVSVTNPLNTACNQTFALRVAQTPVVSTPTTIVRTMSNADFSFSLSNTAVGTGTITWALPNAPPALTISSNGTITFASNNSINAPSLITATNPYGGVSSNTCLLTINQLPVLSTPPTLSTTSNFAPPQNITYSYQMLQTAVGTGPLTWRITDTSNAAVTNLSISSNGLISHTSTYLSQTVRVTATPASGGACNLTFPLTIARTPVIANPGSISTNLTTTNYTYSMCNMLPTTTGPLTWSISSNTGLSIGSNTGIITFQTQNTINTNVVVSGSNSLMASCNVTFAMNIAQSPTITNPPSLQYTRQSNEIYNYQLVQTAANTRTLSWFVGDTTAARVPISGLTINSSGILAYGGTSAYINTNVNVMASNVLGGTDNKTFGIRIAQIPVLAEQAAVVANLTSAIPYEIQIVSLTSTTLTGPITWSITSYTGLSISAAGVVRLNAVSSINRSVTVTATNITGGLCNITFMMTVVQAPVLANPLSLSGSFSGNYTYQIGETSGRVGTFTWSITNYPGLSISSTGLVTLQSSFAVANSNVSVTATNDLGGTSTIPFNMDVIPAPIVLNPVSISANMSTGVDFSYQMIQQQSNTGPVTWTIASPVPPPTGLSIGASTGLIAFPSTASLDATVTVAATNRLNGVGNAAFALKLSPPPSLLSATAVASGSNSAIASWNAGNFTTGVDIRNVTNGFTQSNVPTSPYNWSNLLPNTSYQFQIRPRNVADVYGPSITTSAIVTGPSALGPVTVTSITGTSATANWQPYTGAGATLSWSNVTSALIGSNITSSNITSLLPNYPYVFTVTPYNSINTAGPSSLSPSITTLPFLSNVTISSIGTSNATVTILPGITSTPAYSNIVLSFIQNGATRTVSLVNQSSTILGGLLENTTYTVTAVPYNSIGTAGPSVVAAPFTTKTYLGPLTLGNEGNDYFLSWGTGTYSTVTVSWTGTTSGTQAGITTATVTIFINSTNASYVFSVTAYNSIGTPSQTRSIQISVINGVVISFETTPPP